MRALCLQKNRITIYTTLIVATQSLPIHEYNEQCTVQCETHNCALHNVLSSSNVLEVGQVLFLINQSLEMNFMVLVVVVD